MFAIPTTAGTGSETTGVAIFDLEEMHAKTGIASRVLKPTLGIVDPVKVSRTSLQNAVSVAGQILLTDAIVVEIKDESAAAMPAGAGMPGGMPGMM